MIVPSKCSCTILLVAIALSAWGPAVGPARAGGSADSVVVTTGADSAAAPRAAGVAPARTDTVVVLPEVVVERDRPLSAARRRRPTAFVTEIPVGTSGRAVETLPELLGGVAGVHVVQYGGLGSFGAVSLRGAPAGQVAVYLDGVPMQSAAHRVVDLSELPLGAVQSIEVYQGGAPLVWGPGSSGGAIQLVTGRGARLNDLRVAHGSFDTWQARGTTGFERGAFNGWLHGSYEGSDGDFAYPNDHGTPFNTDDDAVTPRVNNRLDAADVLGNLAWTSRNGWRARLGGVLQRRAQGFPGIGSTPALNAGSRLERGIARCEVARSFGDGGSLRTDASWQGDRRRFDDRQGGLGLGRHLTDDRFAGRQTGLTLESGALPLDVRLDAGATWREEHADLSDALDGRPDPPASSRRTRGATIGARWQPWAGRLLLVAARRWDRITDHLRANGSGTSLLRTDVARETQSPQIGARLLLPLGLELRANRMRAERLPDFMELFGDQGGVVGNPALSPERVESRDVGVAWAIASRRAWGATAQWAHFATRAEDLIVYVKHSQSAVKAQNVSRAEFRGDELSLRLAVPLGFTVAASYTRQSAVDDGDVPFWRGKRIPQRPEHEGDVRAGWRGGALHVGLDVQFMSDVYLDRANRNRVPSRALLGASVGVSLFREVLQLTLEGKNLRDEHPMDVAGYPLPGRSVFFAVEWRPGSAGPK